MRHVLALFGYHQAYRKMVLIKVHSSVIPMGSHGLHWSLYLFKKKLLSNPIIEKAGWTDRVKKKVKEERNIVHAVK